MTTILQYDAVIEKCKDIFEKKMKDYGTAWRILRPVSITDQIFIKAKRIRTLQEIEVSKVQEGIEPEFIGIINYCIMALIQIELKDEKLLELNADFTINLYDKYALETKKLMQDKNHDYGEAWRDMRLKSLADLILMKVLRVKQIEDNKGQTILSEGVEANYMDMINYSVFAMILMNE
jgi:Nucleotide modification associated domain 1